MLILVILCFDHTKHHSGKLLVNYNLSYQKIADLQVFLKRSCSHTTSDLTVKTVCVKGVSVRHAAIEGLKRTSQSLLLCMEPLPLLECSCDSPLKVIKPRSDLTQEGCILFVEDLIWKDSSAPYCDYSQDERLKRTSAVSFKDNTTFWPHFLELHRNAFTLMSSVKKKYIQT